MIKYQRHREVVNIITNIILINKDSGSYFQYHIAYESLKILHYYLLHDRIFLWDLCSRIKCMASMVIWSSDDSSNIYIGNEEYLEDSLKWEPCSRIDLVMKIFIPTWKQK